MASFFHGLLYWTGAIIWSMVAGIWVWTLGGVIITKLHGPRERRFVRCRNIGGIDHAADCDPNSP
jgi:hypothetical protein